MLKELVLQSKHCLAFWCRMENAVTRVNEHPCCNFKLEINRGLAILPGFKLRNWRRGGSTPPPNNLLMTWLPNYFDGGLDLQVILWLLHSDISLVAVIQTTTLQRFGLSFSVRMVTLISLIIAHDTVGISEETF